MKGHVQSGGTSAHVLPLADVNVTLWHGARPIAHTITAADGSFALKPPVRNGDTIFYLHADAGGGVILMALLGNALPDEVVVNELTTVAAVYCAAQFLHEDGSIDGNDLALRIAAGMNANLVDVAGGTSSNVLTSSPNADETNALRSTRSLANLVASCVRTRETCAKLFELTGARTTIAALHTIARHPSDRVDEIFRASKAVDVYEPSLLLPPNSWTLAVKVNDSGDDAHMFGGPGNLAFDRNGNVWITNNVEQGTPYSTNWNIVLASDGKPLATSPFTGGGLVGTGFGVTLSNDGNRVWIGNFGWGGVNPEPRGSVSIFDLDANPLSPAKGFQQETYRVQGMAFDRDGNLWMASYGNNRVVVYRGGDPVNAVFFEFEGDAKETLVPFGVAIGVDGTVWVTNSYKDGSGVIQVVLEGDTIRLLRNITVGQTVKGIVIDSIGTVWIASGGDSYVYAFDKDGNPLGQFNGGGIDGPWGINLDGDDHLWAANFGPLQHGTVFEGRLTQLAGANPATRPPGLQLGDPISPHTGYTLPTAGEQVRLHDGTPLYGPDGPPCFIPYMRLTGVAVDRAGNVWTCNNWKPAFNTDLFGKPSDPIESANPGGDGMVIFIGLAKPPLR